MLDDAARNAPQDDLEPVIAEGDLADRELPSGSLADDISALIEDGKTYFEAELAFQKTRVGYTGQKTKQGIIYSFSAFAFLHLALIGLVVGLILALAPYLTAFGAVAAVVGALLVGAGLFAWLAASRFKAIGSAFAVESEDHEQS